MVEDAVVERMTALVRRVATHTIFVDTDGDVRADIAEAHAIAKLLPEPVDPDVLEVRQLFEAEARALGMTEDAIGRYLAGAMDHTMPVRLALAALRRGRQLAECGRP